MPVKATYPVTGMSCAACAVSVESTIGALEGVIDASVNYANQTLLVEYQARKTDPEKMKQALQAVGYDLVIGEKAADDAEAIRRREYRRMVIRTAVAGIFAVPVMIISMAMLHQPYVPYLLWALSTPVLVYSGAPFFIRAWKQLRHGRANMDTLVALSTGIAYLFSVMNTLYPSFWTSRGLEAHVYFEASASVIAFVLLGKLLEERAKAGASSAIKKLMGLQPGTVHCIRQGIELELPLAAIVPGDIVLARPGDKIAVDGIVTEGYSFVQESTITGESMPAEKQPGDKVYAGTINQKGILRYQAEKVGSETLLGQIIRTVQASQGSKAPVQQLTDKISALFVPLILIIGLLTFGAWALWGGNNGVVTGLMTMVTVLVIACPCALGLATPTAIIAGMGRGASSGILIRNAESLERAGKTNVVLVDKTGTLTLGRPVVKSLDWLQPAEHDLLANVLYSMEKLSGHPLAEALAASIQAREIPLEEFTNHPGKGIQAAYNGQGFFAGNKRWMEENHVPLPAAALALATAAEAEGRTLVWFGHAKGLEALASLEDPLKPGAAEGVQKLQKAGMEVIMLTGDAEAPARRVAALTGVNAWHARMLPQDKAAFVRQLQQQGKTVAMVGDGVNDSEALALADTSVAMGGGSDIAMDVARMTIIGDDLRNMAAAIRLSRKTVTIIRENLFWAFIYNLIGIPLAAGILYPFTGFLLNPMIAGAAMALSSVSVVTNSLRLKFVNL